MGGGLSCGGAAPAAAEDQGPAAADDDDEDDDGEDTAGSNSELGLALHQTTKQANRKSDRCDVWA